MRRWIRSDLLFCSNYFTAAQSPDGTTLMQINGKESPVLELGDGMMSKLQITAALITGRMVFLDVLNSRTSRLQGFACPSSLSVVKLRVRPNTALLLLYLLDI